MSAASEDLNTFGFLTEIPIASELYKIQLDSLNEYSDKEYSSQMKDVLMLINEALIKRSVFSVVTVPYQLGRKTKDRLTELGYFFSRRSWEKDETRIHWDISHTPVPCDKTCR
jgi:hypothetical protein